LGFMLKPADRKAHQPVCWYEMSGPEKISNSLVI
jgi:hypothetical protein